MGTQSTWDNIKGAASKKTNLEKHLHYIVKVIELS